MLKCEIDKKETRIEAKGGRIMQVYTRVVTKREPINRFGKLGFVEHTEVLINPTDDILKEANYKKHIRFVKKFETSFDMTDSEIIKSLEIDRSSKVDILYRN